MNFYLVEMYVNFILENKMIGMGYVIHGLYYVDNMINNIEPQSNVNVMIIKNATNSKHLWHLRLYHIAEDRITKLEKIGILSDLESTSDPDRKSVV